MYNLMNKIVPLKFRFKLGTKASKLELLHSHPELFREASFCLSCGTSEYSPQPSPKAP